MLTKAETGRHRAAQSKPRPILVPGVTVVGVIGASLTWWGMSSATPAKPTAATSTAPSPVPSSSASIERVSREQRPVHPATPQASPAQLRLAAATDIPVRALIAYQRAEATERTAQPNCKIQWQFVAAFGRIETNHGRLNGSAIGADGLDRPALLGPSLDGSQPGVIGSVNDASGAPVRAAGPLQFIPATWSQWGRGDVQNIDAAALAAARYLCADGQVLDNDDARRQAALSYNHVDWYATDVLAIYNDYLNAQPAHSFPEAPGGGGSDTAQPSATDSYVPAAVSPVVQAPASSAPPAAPSSAPAPASSSTPAPAPSGSSSGLLSPPKH